jgi:hypothetical protein
MISTIQKKCVKAESEYGSRCPRPSVISNLGSRQSRSCFVARDTTR